MDITVQQVVDTPHLRTRFLAGRAGAANTINWAHTCELANPWDWLEPFDLLMTNGIGIPEGAAAQVKYVERIADAGLSGIAIGEDVAAPELTPELAAAADRHALPLLLTAYEVPFAAIARVVADSKAHPEERLRLVKTARIYDCVRANAASGGRPRELLAALGRELDCRFAILDTSAWRDALAPAQTAPTATRAVLEQAAARNAGRLPAILRLEIDGSGAVAVPLPSSHPAVLLASHFGSSAPGLSLLQHVATVAALALEQLISAREQQHRANTELLSALIAGRLDSAEGSDRLRRAGLAARALTVAVWRDRRAPGTAAVPADQIEIHHGLFSRDTPHLLCSAQGEVVALLANGSQHLESLLEVLPADTRIGLREQVQSPLDIPDAVRQARWALLTLASDQRRIARYTDDQDTSAPFTFDRAADIAEHTLGPLRRYDREHRGQLIRTLAAWLRNDRSASRTAAALYIHRQTLVYRLRRIEQLTALQLGSTRSVVELWLALRALEVVEGSVLLEPSAAESPA